jgi:hypothetical protein
MISLHRKRTGSGSLWQLVTVGAFALYLVLALVHVLAGRLNADEGWYLYAAQLVFKGDIPYRDFAYTQTPLLPYVYGLPQLLFQPSIYLGRATSLLLAVTTFALCVLLAKTHADKMAAGLTGLFLATFTYGIYFSVIVKTYALLSFLFTLTFLVLSSRLTDRVKYPLAVVFAMCAAMVRLSAILFAAVIVAYSLVKTQWPVRYIILAFCGIVAVAALLLTVSNSHAVEWNLLGHHLGKWEEVSALGRIGLILSRRIPLLIVFFMSYATLGLSLALIVSCESTIRRKARLQIRRFQPILAVAVGLVLFAFAHLGTGGFNIEYFVPAIVSFFPILSIVFVGVYRNLDSGESESTGPSRTRALAKSLLQVVVIIALLLFPVRHSANLVDLSGGQLPIEEVKEVSRYVAQNTDTSDRILALEALWVVIESNTTVLPGLTMAQFSYQNVSKEEAQDLKLVNNELLLQYIECGAAKVVLFTDLDWKMLQQTQESHAIRKALANHYEFVLAKEHFGQRAGTVYVYLLTDEEARALCSPP